MGIQLRRGLAAAAAAGLALVMPAQAHASAAGAHPEFTPPPPRVVGGLTMWTHALPRTIKRGQSIWFMVWYEDNSPDQLHIGDFSLHLRNANDHSGSGYNGITGYFLDPRTKHWERSNTNPVKGWMDFPMPGWQDPASQLTVQPHTVHGVYMRLTVGTNAALGNWTVEPDIDYWSLWSNGQMTIDLLTDAQASYRLTVTR